MTTYRYRLICGAVSLVASATLTACSPPSPKASAATTPATQVTQAATQVTSASTPPPKTSNASADATANAKSAALAAYNGMMAAWVHASLTADKNDPQLAEHATGDALTRLQAALSGEKAAGVHFVGAPKDSPQVQQMTPQTAPNQAYVVSCMDASSWLGHKANGALATTNPAGKHRIEALVNQAGGSWKVSQMAVRAAGTC